MSGLKRRGGNGDGGNDKKNIVCENLEEGKEYESRLVYVADLGLHENSYKGEEKANVQKIALGLEVLGETVEIDGEVRPRLLWGKPFNIYWEMTPNGTELVNYKVFDPSAKEGEVADWEKVLGTPVNLTIVHVADKKDKSIKYDNIASVVPIPKKYQKDIGKATLTPCVGDADDENNDATRSLYGLTKWFFDRRIVEGGDSSEPVVEVDEGSIPF
jgi:hypothetical protein